jgi:branched-chain amino acid transport system substrate-binding protein
MWSKRSAQSVIPPGLAIAAKPRWPSPRGPMSTDRATGEVIQNIYIRKVEKMNGQNYNVEFSTFEAVRDWRAAAK